MISIFLTFLAATSGAISNLILRVGSGTKDSSTFYLWCFYFSSFAFSFFIFPQLGKTEFNGIIFGIGCLVGFCTFGVMIYTAQALQTGPAGLTFAFQNASAVFPGLILFLLFGYHFGFSFSLFQLGGLMLVLMGMFYGTKKSSSLPSSNPSFIWLKYALACFFFQVCVLTLIQGRALLFHETFLGEGWLTEGSDGWFMPGQFGTAFLLQTLWLLRKKGSYPVRVGLYGFLGGGVNLVCTFLLLVATRKALPSYQVMLFPFFSVAIIILCNIWATLLYKEPFNFGTNGICTAGILLGTLG